MLDWNEEKWISRISSSLVQNISWRKPYLWRFWEAGVSLVNLAADLTQRFHQTSRHVRRPSQFNLSSLTWPRKSISGSQECHYLATTRPPPNSNLQFGLQPQNPYRWHRDHLNDSYCGENPPSTALCVKRSRMFGRYYPGWCHWKVEECHSQQTLGFSLWTAVDCSRDNIGLNPERNVSTESMRGRHPVNTPPMKKGTLKNH